MTTESYRRWVVGILCLVMGDAAAWLNLIDPELGDRYPQFQAASLRLLPVLAVLWLAMPEMRRGPGSIVFLFVALFAVVMLLSKNALKFVVPAVGVLFVIAWLRKLTAAFGGKSREKS